MSPVLTIVVANLKGGSAKTTTAAFILHALAESGLSVLGVDADGENESLLSWSEAGEWSIPVIGMPVTDLHRKLPGVAGDRYDAVVIDTPPMKERRGVVASAIRLATHVLVPMAPTGMEYAHPRAGRRRGRLGGRRPAATGRCPHPYRAQRRQHRRVPADVGQ